MLARVLLMRRKLQVLLGQHCAVNCRPTCCYNLQVCSFSGRKPDIPPCATHTTHTPHTHHTHSTHHTQTTHTQTIHTTHKPHTPHIPHTLHTPYTPHTTHITLTTHTPYTHLTHHTRHTHHLPLAHAHAQAGGSAETHDSKARKFKNSRVE